MQSIPLCSYFKTNLYLQRRRLVGGGGGRGAIYPQFWASSAFLACRKKFASRLCPFRNRMNIVMNLIQIIYPLNRFVMNGCASGSCQE